MTVFPVKSEVAEEDEDVAAEVCYVPIENI